MSAVLAWAAGFYEGEGCLSIHRDKNRPKTALLRLSISQTDPEVLDRFRRAVTLGRIRGPYRASQPNANPVWHFGAHNFEHAQAIIAMLWGWLGPVKRAQARRICEEIRRVRAIAAARRLSCRRGHRFTADNVIRKGTRQKQCRRCAYEAHNRWSRAKRAYAVEEIGKIQELKRTRRAVGTPEAP